MSGNAELERRYRQAMRAYPARWLTAHGEELLGVMLDLAMEEGRERPARFELLHLVLQGTAARVNQHLPRRRRNRLAAVGTVAGTSLALVMMLLGEVGRWFRWNSYNLVDHPFGAFTTPAAIVFVLTITAFLAVAVGRPPLAKLLHAAAIAACVGVGIIMAVTEPGIPVHLVVFAFFAAANLLALLGNPVQTPVLRNVVLTAGPSLGVFLTLTSYLQGGGAQRSFWGGPYLINDFRMAFWGLELLLVAALLVMSGRKIRPWACLVLIPLTSLPLSGMFLTLGGNSSIGLIGVQPAFFYTVCSATGLLSAWVAWKRPVLKFQARDTPFTAA